MVVHEPLNYMFFGLAVVPILYAFRVNDFFLRTNPDRLQSERYLIEREAVARMGVNSPDGPKEIILSANAALIGNPNEVGGSDE